MENIGNLDDIQNLFKETIAKSWRTAWRQSWMTSWSTANTTTRIRTQTTAATATAAKPRGYGGIGFQDRKEEFEPQVLKKNQTSIIQDIEEKILSMCAKGKIPYPEVQSCRFSLQNPRCTSTTNRGPLLIYCGKLAYGRRRNEKVPGPRNQYHIVKQKDYMLYDGIHEPIISEADWQMAQKQRQ